jgi:ubiquinone/menaquinone biosynthesis C-methylase UbiE
LRWSPGLNCEAGHGFRVVDDVPVLVEDGETVGEAEQHEHQRELYDREYGQMRAHRVEAWQQAYLERLGPVWSAMPLGSVFLDAGAGGSAYTVLEAARRGFYGVGCDLSIEGMRAATRYARELGLGDRCLFVACRAERLPFEDGAFQAAVSIAVLEHLPDDRKAIGELARVTRPGGRVFFTVPNTLERMPAPLRPLYRWHDRRVGHLRHYSAGELAGRSRGVGLKLLEVTYSAHWIKVWQLLMHLATQRVRLKDDRLWWWMERRDRRAARKDNGMHLHVLLERS